MGSGKNSRTVYDFLMSIDYGVCLGRVDSVNQIWVKDRPIFCGRIQQRTDVDVNQPDLFGGDDGEGGTVGAVEVYVGDQDQLASDHLAARNGLTPALHPGYRDICHIFFRGRGTVSTDNVVDIAVDENGDPAPPEDEFETGLAQSIIQRGVIGTLLSGGGSGGGLFGIFRSKLGIENEPKGGDGFRWTSNNPYLPAAKVHLTRLFNMGLDQQWAAIYPIKNIENGVPIPHPDFLFTPEPFVVDGFGPNAAAIDLTERFTRAQIDSGFIQVTVTITANCILKGGIHGEGPAPSSNAFFFDFFDDTGTEIEGAGGSALASGDGLVSATTVKPVPAGTVNVGTNVSFNRTLFLSSIFILGSHSMTFDYVPGGGEPGDNVGGDAHCDPSGEGLRTMPNANPAHIIYDAMTNQHWGMGGAPASFNTDSFNAAAETLHGEFMGLFIKWIQQGDIETLVGEVLDHINGLLYQDPATGLWNLKLLRDDYDAAAQPLLDPSNCTAKNRKRRAWGETVNEMVVKWTDPLTEELASVSAHNLSNISIQGGVVPDTRTYYGVRDEIVAQRLAERDVSAAGYPLFTSEIYVDRSEWETVPGDIRRFSWPEDGIENIVVRVLEVDRGDKAARQIKLSVTEDIFSVDQTEYSEPQRGFWNAPSEVPVPFDAEIAIDVPLPALLRNGGVVADIDAAFPETSVALFGEHDTVPVIDFDALTEVTRANGSVALETILTAPDTRALLTGGPMFAQEATLLDRAFIEALTYGNATEGDLLLIGPSAGGEHEIIMLDSYDAPTDAWTLARGIWDTVPLAWPSASRIWDFSTDPVRVDPEPRAAGATVTYRLLPRTITGRLDVADAADIDHVVTERPFRPFRPANTQLDGAGFDKLVYDDPSTTPTQMTATWATRNRETEDRIAPRWTDASVTPETGQTTTLRVYDTSDVLVATYDTLTGTSHVIPFADLGTAKEGYVTFHSGTPAGESLWAAKRAFSFRATGYGRSYGRKYGG